MVVVTLVQVEAVQVVCHLAVVERLARLLDSIAVIVAMRCLRVNFVGRIVTVDYLDELGIACTRRVVEDGVYASIWCARRADPAVLDIA